MGLSLFLAVFARLVGGIKAVWQAVTLSFARTIWEWRGGVEFAIK
jgi:hypothetical protein